MRRIRDYPDDVKLSITPLIDVTFLLLVFFMCAMKFKTLERKVAAFLPTDRGQAITVKPFDPEVKISVRLAREPGEAATGVKLLDEALGTGETAFTELDRRVAGIAADPRNQDWPGEIDAAAEVPHHDVVRCLDAFLKAGIGNVRFVGAPEPGRETAR